MQRAVLLYFLFFSALTGRAAEIRADAETLFETGKSKYLSYKYREAVIDFEKASSFFVTDSNYYAVALFNTRAFLINAYWNLGQGRKAEKMAKICYDKLTSFQDNENPGLIDAYLLLAEFYVPLDISFDINDFLLEKAGRIIAGSYRKDQRKSGVFYSIKGYSDFLKNDLDNAYYYLNRSTEILKEFPDLIRYEILNDVHITYLKIELKQFDEAVHYANNALERKNPAREGRLLLIHALTHGYNRSHDTLRAIEYCRKMINSINISDSEGLATEFFLMNRAFAYLAYYEKNRDKQLLYLKKSLSFAQKLTDRGKEIANLNYHIGWIYYLNKEPMMVLRYMQKALIASTIDYNDTSVLSNPPVDKLMNFENMVNILFMKGTELPLINTNDKSYTKLALQCFEMAYTLLDKQLHKIKLESSVLNLIDIRQHLLGYVVTYSNYIYRYTGEEEYARKAFYYAEKGKAQVLKMYTGKDQTLKDCGVPDSIIEKSVRISNEILQTENMIALVQEKGRDISEFTDRLTRLGDQRDLLHYEIERKYPLYQKVGYYPRIPEIEEIQSVLQPDQALIEYEMVLPEVIIFVITKTGFYQYHQEIYSDTHYHLENLRQLVSSAPLSDNSDSAFRSFVKSSSFLYNLLIRPVYDKIKGNRLIIIPQGKMMLIPFEVLISEDYSGRSDYSKLNWLIREFPVMYAFSASYLVDKKNRESGKGMAAFMPVYHNTDSFSSLEGAADEVRFLRKKLDFNVFAGQLSDEDNFRKNAPRFGIIHIAAHTLTNDARPDLSGFVLNQPKDSSNDGRLYAFEIKQLKLNAQMVVLNGCNTGYGTLIKGEGMVSLARSFFFTGIRTVAYTLWPVVDLAAHDLVIRFYKEVYKHQPPDLALRISKLAFIENSDPVKAHPYYWAGFIVSGKPITIPYKHDYTKPAAVILLILASLAAYLIVRDNHRRREDNTASERSA